MAEVVQSADGHNEEMLRIERPDGLLVCCWML
jgi:hypothetical protein